MQDHRNEDREEWTLQPEEEESFPGIPKSKILDTNAGWELWPTSQEVIHDSVGCNHYWTQDQTNPNAVVCTNCSMGTIGSADPEGNLVKHDKLPNVQVEAIIDE